ncbi:MAG TPA: cytoplasmic protein [Desulfobulbus sp.]|nr:cytoplasmic protein [Desulfobulbus sp.]
MNKVILFAFRGDPMCFVHVLLNGLDMAERGQEGKIIIEGDAVKLIPEMAQPDHFLHQLYLRAVKTDIIIGACRACSTKLGVAAAIEQEGVRLVGDMSGHPAMSDYIARGYTIITF